MEELSKHGAVGLAAIKAGMDRKTARKYIVAAALPSQMRAPRDWRTREDPFAEHREEIEALLRDTPELEAKTIFELLTVKHPDRFAPGQLRTLQRMIRAWRAAQGAEKEVVLAQRHREQVVVQRVVEGDGTAVMLEFVARSMGLDLRQMPEMVNRLGKQMMQMSMGQTPLFSQAPAVLRETLIFPYAAGLDFIESLRGHVPGLLHLEVGVEEDGEGVEADAGREVGTGRDAQRRALAEDEPRRLERLRLLPRLDVGEARVVDAQHRRQRELHLVGQPVLVLRDEPVEHVADRRLDPHDLVGGGRL